MNEYQWQAFKSFREEFKQKCENWATFAELLEPLQKTCAEKDTPFYPIENSIVYNSDLDKIDKNSDIRLIIIGDNPGKNEQLSINRRYLCGQSGKIADGFFKRNSCLGVDFYKNAIILNKTPLHTAKTSHLKAFANSKNEQIVNLLRKSQIWMAKATAKLHQELVCYDDETETATITNNMTSPCTNYANSVKIPSNKESHTSTTQKKCQLWLVGYSELKNKGVFLPYKTEFFSSYKNQKESWDNVKVFQHFSMNRFLIDLKMFQKQNSIYENNLQHSLNVLGNLHRDEIFTQEL